MSVTSKIPKNLYMGEGTRNITSLDMKLMPKCVATLFFLFKLSIEFPLT